MKIRGLSSFRSARNAMLLEIIAGGAGIVLVFALSHAQASGHESYQNDPYNVPFMVTTRVYEMRAKPGSYKDVTDQLFKLRSTNFVDEEKIISNFAKVFPGFDFALLKSSRLRVNRTSKGTILNIGKNQNRSFDLVHSGANSPGVGNKPGTTLVIEANLTVGRPEAISYGIQTVEAEDGMTYFFSPPKLKFGPADYALFMRPGVPAKSFEGYDRFLVVAVSVELVEKQLPARSLDATQSVELQNAATKKVAPDVSADVRALGLKGKVSAQVEIGLDGRVTHAIIENSTLPEMNAAVIAAVRQWEFPTKSFEASKKPVKASLVFDFTQTASNAQGAQGNSSSSN